MGLRIPDEDNRQIKRWIAIKYIIIVRTVDLEMYSADQNNGKLYYTGRMTVGRSTPPAFGHPLPKGEGQICL
jgi:hypothetical protein